MLIIFDTLVEDLGQKDPERTGDDRIEIILFIGIRERQGRGSEVRWKIGMKKE